MILNAARFNDIDSKNNLKNIDDDTLVNKTKELVLEEKKLTLEILDYLKEIESRQLFLTLGYSSMFEFATQSLGYSPGAAQRRIESMRLLKSVSNSKAIENKVKTGELSLSTLALTQSFFKTERKENHKTYTPEQKQEILNTLSGKSSRDAEKELIKLSPTFVPSQLKDKEKFVSEDKILVQFMIDEELKSLLDQVKNLVACPQDLNPSYNTVLKKIAKFYLSKKDLSQQKPKEDIQTTPTPESKKNSLPMQPEFNQKNSRYVSTETKRKLFFRSLVNNRAQCEYFNPVTKQRCTSTYALEIDHVKPFAFGGGSEFSNLQVLCRNHNILRAYQTFGKRPALHYK